MKILSRLLKKKAFKKPLPVSELEPLQGKVIQDEDLKDKLISKNLQENMEFLEDILGRNIDFTTREIKLGSVNKERVCLVYMESMVDKERISNNLLKSLLFGAPPAGIDEKPYNLIDLVEKMILADAEIRSKVNNMLDMLNEILFGGIGVLIEGCEEAAIVLMKSWPQRGVEKADNESVVRGPKESFNENIGVNIALVRRKLRSPNLVIEGFNLGRISNTAVSIAYIKGIVIPDLVQEVKSRLSRIDIDAILESNYIEELIEDEPFTPFPSIGFSERPDRIAASLLQGRVCIFSDGTPMVLFVPSAFSDLITGPEDYYQNWIAASAIRMLRFVGLVIALLLPSFYIAVTTFHQEMIPTQLLISIAASREGVPFPALIEALIMEVTFEALREAGLKLPRAIGPAVSIVGGLVIGQAAVQAAIVSPLMVIVVAITGIASFMIPSYNFGLAIRLLRFPLMILAATLGLFGVMTGVLALLIHLAGLRSFGMPYLSPVAPLKKEDLKDFLIRVPWWAMHKRPSEAVKRNKQRIAPNLKPHPPQGGDTGNNLKGFDKGLKAQNKASTKASKSNETSLNKSGSRGNGGQGDG